MSTQSETQVPQLDPLTAASEGAFYLQLLAVAGERSCQALERIADALEQSVEIGRDQLAQGAAMSGGMASMSQLLGGPPKV